jgi:hypothetical protein
VIRFPIPGIRITRSQNQFINAEPSELGHPANESGDSNDLCSGHGILPVLKRFKSLFVIFFQIASSSDIHEFRRVLSLGNGIGGGVV